MLGLVDFLIATGVEVNVDNLKIHLACWNGKVDPLDEYYAGNFPDWQARQGKRNFPCAQILSLIARGRSDWLFAGLYTVLDCEQRPQGGFKYLTKLVPKQDDIIGRISVSHDRASRQPYIWYGPEIALPIAEIRREKLTIEDFPGYNSVVLSHKTLTIIIGQKLSSWHGALANIKGVYLITDTSTGKHYVGKASGGDGIWQRWCSYSENGHGDNKELKKLLSEKGAQHMAHFQFSILEIADTHASESDILKRELHWMRALKSHEFGLNCSYPAEAVALGSPKNRYG